MDYSLLRKQLLSITEGIPYPVTNLANASALLYDAMDDINWAGFYLMTDGRLVLGPFQGKPACTIIEVGRGVCGTAVKENATQLVYDVHKFPGHIACSSESRSEIVVPVWKDNAMVAVLDIDSRELGCFDGTDRIYLEEIAGLL